MNWKQLLEKLFGDTFKVPAEPTEQPTIPTQGGAMYYLLQSGNGTSLVNIKDLQLPKIAGMCIRFRGDWIRPSARRVDWSFVDRSVEKMHQVNKPYSLLLMTGSNSPEWIGGEWLNGGPLPWSPENKKYMGEMYAMMNERYGKDSLWKYLHVSGGTRGSTSEEMHADPQWGTKNHPKIVEAYKGFIDAAEESKRHLLLAISGQKQALTYVKPIMDYYLLKGNRTVKNNALKGETNLAADHNKLVVEGAKKTKSMSFEMVGPLGSKVMDGVNKGYAMAKQAGVTQNNVLFFIYPQPADIKALK
jgi:hypothetical protein